jgi:hypothetical protein
LREGEQQWFDLAAGSAEMPIEVTAGPHTESTPWGLSREAKVPEMARH